jgi:protoporphyrinogen oxidase
MFFLGGACLPANGMQGLVHLLARDIPINFEEEVIDISKNQVSSRSGRSYTADTIIITAPEHVSPNAQWHGTSTFYFYTTENIAFNKILLLVPNDKPGMINHIANLSEINPNYSPKGTSLLSVSTVGACTLEAMVVLDSLAQILNVAPNKFHFIRRFDISKAIPFFCTIDLERSSLCNDGIEYISTVASYGSQNSAILLGPDYYP